MGKTVVSAGLTRALAAQGVPVHYIKPLQTGAEFDEEKVSKTVRSTVGADAAALVHTQTLFSWPEPVSPHIAAAEAPLVTNDMVVRALQECMELKDVEECGHWTIIETAGGVLSPGPAQDRITTQADVFKACRFPAILVGDAALGGISTTMAALESLAQRDYTVDAVIMIDKTESSDLGNSSAVADMANGIPVYRLPALPPAEFSLDSWHQVAEPIFRKILTANCPPEEQSQETYSPLPELSTQDILDVDAEKLWHPYTSATKPLACLGVVDRAEGVRLHLEGGLEVIDGMSSWWAAVHGYAVPELDAAAKGQIDRMSHVSRCAAGGQPLYDHCLMHGRIVSTHPPSSPCRFVCQGDVRRPDTPARRGPWRSIVFYCSR